MWGKWDVFIFIFCQVGEEKGKRTSEEEVAIAMFMY